MTNVDRVMIEARKNLAKEMKARGKSEDEIYLACVGLKYESYITEIRNAEKAIENYAMYYHARENECPDSFKFLMLVNGWHSPFVALNELLKVIEKNEILLKKEGLKKGYKSRCKEMKSLVRKYEIWR